MEHWLEMGLVNVSVTLLSTKVKFSNPLYVIQSSVKTWRNFIAISKMKSKTAKSWLVLSKATLKNLPSRLIFLQLNQHTE